MKKSTGQRIKTPITRQFVVRKIKDYLIMTAAAFLNSASLYIFVNPSNIIAGGFSGLSSVLSYVFDMAFPNVGFNVFMWIIYFTLNVPLLICALVLLRGDFTFKTIYATVASTAFLALFPMLPVKLEFSNSTLLSVIFGGIMIGIAMYIASEVNGSNGGTEIVARIVSSRRPEIDLSKVILITNFAMTFAGSVATVILKHFPVDKVLYSMIYILIGGTVMGMFKRGFNHPQKFCVITTEYERLGRAITETFKRGYTFLDVENRYDGRPRKMIVVVIQYRQMSVLKRIIRTIDPESFTFVKDVYDVFSRPTFNRSYKTK